MPTYEYECTKCGKVFEVFQSIKDAALRRLDCDQCGRKMPVLRRIGGGSGVIFKGSGFYQTDYRSEGYKKAAKADKEGGTSQTPSAGDGATKKGDIGTTGGDKQSVTDKKNNGGKGKSSRGDSQSE